LTAEAVKFSVTRELGFCNDLYYRRDFENSQSYEIGVVVIQLHKHYWWLKCNILTFSRIEKPVLSFV